MALITQNPGGGHFIKTEKQTQGFCGGFFCCYYYYFFSRRDRLGREKSPTLLNFL